MQTLTILPASVQSLKIQMLFNDTRLATGTAFLVKIWKGHALVTNRHNLTGRDYTTAQPLSSNGGIPNKIRIWHNKIDELGSWLELTEDLYYDGDFEKPRWIEHPTLGKTVDVAVLPLQNGSGIETYCHSLTEEGPSILVQPADIVSVVGFPFGLSAGKQFAVWATGFVASEPDLNYEDLPCFLIDCRSRQGQSGSAVVAQRNGGMIPLKNGTTAVFDNPVSNLLGIYSGRIHSQSDIGRVWKKSVIVDIVRSIT